MASQTFEQYLRNGIRLICAVCGREVDELRSTYDVRTRAMLYLVRCHGQEQRVELSEYLIAEAGPRGITVGRAFDVPQITEG